MDRKRHKRNGGAGDRRLHINIFNIVFTGIVLVAANGIAGSDFTERINRISHNLNRSLGIVLDNQMTNYSSIYENVTYYSTTAFHPRAMAVLYNVTTKFMDLIASKDVYPEGFIKVKNGELELSSFQEQWQSILTHYGAILAVVIVLLFFAVFMPICGFFFCCCRCCGKCGARSKPFDKKGDLCKKICLASLLICVGTLLLFGVVCAFVTNQNLQDHTYELSPTFKNGVKDTDSYLKYTDRQFNGILNVNYKEFETGIFNTLNECSNIVSEQLEDYSNATSLSEVIDIVETLVDNFEVVEKSSNVLVANASQLDIGLRKVRKDLYQVLTNCDLSACKSLPLDEINKLQVNIEFDLLIELRDKLGAVKTIISNDIRNVLKEGEDALAKIKTEINSTVSNELPKVRNSISKVGVEIIKFGTNISSVITRACHSLHEYADPPIDEMDKYIKEYTPYRYYLGIAISCILLLVSLCITLGLICGICGKRPDAYGDDCCNKGAGSRFLMLGVAIMFLFSIVLAAVAIVYFFTGILAQRLACDSLRNPNNSQVLRLVDQVVNIKHDVGVDVNISSVLISIHKNKSIYYAFNLKKYYDLEEVPKYMQKFEIDQMLSEFKKKITANTKNIKLIDAKAKRDLEKLIQSEMGSINYDKYIYELQGNFTNVGLNFLAGKLDELVAIITKQYPSEKDTATGLMLSSLHLRTYQDNLVVPMTNRIQPVIESVKALESSFNATLIEELIIDLEKAEKYLHENGTKAMEKIADNFAQGLERQVKTYLEQTVLNVEEHVGVTQPVSLILNATLVATCDKILLPWNGFWFSILWCLILFIPAIILSVKLAGLYQKYEAYPGPLVEAEYLYDAYAERDNIPLSSSRNDKRYKKKKKHKRQDGRGSYVAEPPGDHGIAREVPSGSARYADMAPKHWEEFPAGGPPHYQRAPTEYERPPPYYYPGTERQQQ